MKRADTQHSEKAKKGRCGPGGTLAGTKVHDEGERVKRLPPALALGLLIALAGLLAVALPHGADIEENYGLQWLFDVRGPVQPPSEVVVIAIDEVSARKLRLPDKPRDRGWRRSGNSAPVHSQGSFAISTTK